MDISNKNCPDCGMIISRRADYCKKCSIKYRANGYYLKPNKNCPDCGNKIKSRGASHCKKCCYKHRKPIKTWFKKGERSFPEFGFKKGESRIPWNKGLRGVYHSPGSGFKKGCVGPKTKFKKGHIPKNGFKKGESKFPEFQFKKGYVLSLEAKRKRRLAIVKYQEQHGGCSPTVGKFEKQALDYCERRDSCVISRGYRICNLGYFPDGYCHETNTVYEIYEDYNYHSKNGVNDERRMLEIQNQLNCDFIILWVNRRGDVIKEEQHLIKEKLCVI
jgi:hypothetical protein